MESPRIYYKVNIIDTQQENEFFYVKDIDKFRKCGYNVNEVDKQSEVEKCKHLEKLRN